MRRRFESNDTVEWLQLTDLTSEERTALELVVGLPSKNSRSLRLDVRAVDEALTQAGLASSLRHALELLDGPITNKAAELADRQRDWLEVISSARHERLIEWLSATTKQGLLKRLARSDTSAARLLCRRVEAVLGRLPCMGVPRSQLAAELFGDAHALDQGRAVATVVISILRAKTASSVGKREPVEADGEMSTDEAEEEFSARDLWADVGVLVNELARPALLLNVPFEEDGDYRPQPGRPTFLSLRDLVRKPPAWRVQRRDVFICENPNVVAIVAGLLGAACAPLVCTDGMPAAAQRILLKQLRLAGATLRYHGDFDWPGVQIANEMVDVFGALPWRFGATDYEAAVNQADEPAPLKGSPVSTPWESGLAESMKRTGLAAAEEAVVASLIEDLKNVG
jgi:uncharacterized protein (TIGR02679 family)